MRFAASKPITDFLQRKENYQDVASRASVERAKENAMASKAEGLVAGTGMQSEAAIKSAKLGAAATRYAGQQAGNAAMFGGLMSGISGLAGGAIDKYGGGYDVNKNSFTEASPFRTDLDLDLGTSMNFGDYSGVFAPKY